MAGYSYITANEKEDTEMTHFTAESLTAIGGKLWENGSMRRIYFNDLPELFGLVAERYNTGNISAANLNGASISNSRAREIHAVLSTGKLWYDLTSNEFASKIGYCRTFSAEQMQDAIITEITMRAAEAVAA